MIFLLGMFKSIGLDRDRQALQIARVVGEEFGIALGTTYRVAIATELCVAFLALLRPRWGWAPVRGLTVSWELPEWPGRVRLGAAAGCCG